VPSRNTVKEFGEDEYYHVYNRGVEKRKIFLDDNDYTVFLGLLKKYLIGEKDNNTNRHEFDNLSGQVQLLSYCLMPNHFHLLIYQASSDGITKLMRRVITGYVMYFNNRYNRVGALFQARYKASRVDKDDYLHHISRYIHLNPDDYLNYPYSSTGYYLQTKKTPEWLVTDPILSLFNSVDEYKGFLEDYVNTRHEIDIVRLQLATDLDEL
jgi:putative transposase